MVEDRYRYCLNPRWTEDSSRVLSWFNQEIRRDAQRFHESLPEYRRTPLRALDDLAARIGIRCLLVKDESLRFGLNSFKSLGASYAVHSILASASDTPRVLSAATEGNHGLGVAWTAQSLGLEAVIYAPKHTSSVRLEAIRRVGARVVAVDGSYQDTVNRMASESAKHQYTVVSDTGYEGYMEIPRLVTAGYFTLFGEVDDQIKEASLPSPDCLFLQGGVGTFASSGIAYYQLFSPSTHSPVVVTSEPLEADCLLASAASPKGNPQHSNGKLETKMAGLNCGFPSIVAWPIVRSGTRIFMAVADDLATNAAELLSKPSVSGQTVSTSESGAAGLAALLACSEDPQLRDRLGLDRETTALIINTEGHVNNLSGVGPRHL